MSTVSSLSHRYLWRVQSSWSAVQGPLSSVSFSSGSGRKRVSQIPVILTLTLQNPLKEPIPLSLLCFFHLEQYTSCSSHLFKFPLYFKFFVIK